MNITSQLEEILKEFDNEWKSLENLYFAYVGANKESKREVKHFISTHFRTSMEALLETLREENVEYGFPTELQASTTGNNKRNHRLEKALEEVKK